MTAFTIITGIVTLIGFFLQLKGLLPQYRRYYAAATFFLFGLTVGLVMASLAHVTVNFPEFLTIRTIVGLLLFGGSSLLIFICFTASALIQDEKRRNDVSKIGSAVSGFLVLLVLLGPSSWFPVRQSLLTYDEQIETAISAAKKQNFDRALTLFQNTFESLPVGDSRRESVKQLIEETKKQQKAVLSSWLTAPTDSGSPK